MPITLGCPSCSKRFRARDESAGKRVKCPFCQAAVPVPSATEAENAAAGTDSSPALDAPPFGAESVSAVPSHHGSPTPVPASPPDEWGAGGPPPPLKPESQPPAPVFSAPAPKTGKAAKPLPPPTEPGKPAKQEKSPQEQAASAWKKARGGLWWVLFALFWFALVGFVPFAKLVYERSRGPLPAGEGADWVKIDGVLNTPGPDAIQLDKREMIDLLAYGVPLVVGGLALALGRLTAGAAPRSSGAKGLFGFSGLFALLAVAAFVTWKVCERVAFREVAGYARVGTFLGAGLSEFWFLLALGASAATLRRPKAVRTVGFFALLVGLAAVIYDVGWDVYVDKIGPEVKRPRQPDPDWHFFETAAGLLGWVILVGVYWRAVRGVRVAIREFVEDIRGGAAK